MLKRNTSGLEAHAQKKRESAIKRTEDAIARLIQDKRPVNFKTVSEESGVSRTWLYKEPEIKAKINQIKNKQSSKSRSTSRTTDNSSHQPIDTSVIDEFKKKIKKLETENYALRSHLEVVYGMADPDLVEKVEVLQRENEALKMGIKGSSDEATQQLEARIHSLELENQKLIQENQQIDQLKIDLVLAQQKLRDYQCSLASSKPKLIVLEHSREEATGNDLNQDDIQARLKKIGVRLSKKLNELIESLEKIRVKNAILAVEEYLDSGKKVKSKAGLLRKALEENWTPNLTEEERAINQVKDNFSEWYKLAKEEGIAQASQGTSKGIIVLEPTGEWTPFKDMLEKGWTLEYLQERSKR
ncbi:MAG: DUF6262 family protein [Prochloraceae cyanobacterium]|nr:DUF6262 family protein [Prochloraceae cyanobacterium]